MTNKISYNFEAELWKSDGVSAWHFVTLPIDISQEIRNYFQWQEEGWGRMRAMAFINEVNWETAIWFDSKQSSYLLPIKASIRHLMGLTVGDKIAVRIHI